MTDQKKAAPKPKAMRVGDEWTLPKGESMVVRPDGTVVTARGTYRLDQPGVHHCGSSEVTAE